MLIGAVGVLTLALGLSACGTGDDGNASPGPTAASPTTVAPPMSAVLEVLPGLCAARDRAATDLTAARDTFYARSHDPLHTIARDLQPVDRALAARLLEAKEAVETDLNTLPADANSQPAANTPVADLDALVDVTSRSLERLLISGEPCP